MCTFITATWPRQHRPWLKAKWRVKRPWEVPKTTSRGRKNKQQGGWIILDCMANKRARWRWVLSAEPQGHGIQGGTWATSLQSSDATTLMASKWLTLQAFSRDAVDFPSLISSSSSSFFSPLSFAPCQKMRDPIAPSSEVKSPLHGSGWAGSTRLHCQPCPPQLSYQCMSAPLKFSHQKPSLKSPLYYTVLRL